MTKQICDKNRRTYIYTQEIERGERVEGRGQEKLNGMREVARYIEGCILAAGKKKNINKLLIIDLVFNACAIKINSRI